MSGKLLSLVVVVVGFTQTARAEEKKAEPMRVSIELTEGSRLIGTTTEAPLHLITSGQREPRDRGNPTPQ